MPDQLKIGQRRVWMHKGIVTPDFGAPHVLSDDPWAYVELFLKRAKSNDALGYWLQARRFAEASKLLSAEAAPLTLYYSFLNSSKALLIHKHVQHRNQHGVVGRRPDEGRSSLANETVRFQSVGILPALCNYFNEGVTQEEYDLKNILWNIPFIHRAFCLSFTSSPELFIPLENAAYFRHDRTREAWFCAEIIPRYSDQRTLQHLPRSFETRQDGGKKLLIRSKRFNWYFGRTSRREKTNANHRLQRYHSSLRRVVCNISGARDLWYIKKYNRSNKGGARHTIVLIFAAMHRLSELSRYDPGVLDKHLSGQANWLLVEFINHSMDQFIDQVATEITGFQFWPPKMRS